MLLMVATASSFAQNGVQKDTLTYQTLGKWSSTGFPDYLIKPDVYDTGFVNRIFDFLVERRSVPKTNPELLQPGSITNIRLIEDAEVFVSFVYEGAGYKNALGFYYYDEKNPPTTAKDIAATLTIVFPNTSLNGSGGSLSTGDKVQLGSFKAGTIIGWFVVADGFVSGTNSYVKNKNWVLYSDPSLNDFIKDTTIRQHNLMLYDNTSKSTILAFEDIRRDYGSSDQDFNDVLFRVSSNPITAIDTNKIPEIDENPDPGFVDITVEKFASDSSVIDGQKVTYTIRAKNIGTAKATGVEVADILPQGVIYKSHTATKGTFAVTRTMVDFPIWKIGDIDAGATEELVITCEVDIDTLLTAAFDLGLAKDYNLFVIEDLTQPSSDTEGKIAVGGDAMLSNYSVAYELNGATDDVLIVNGNLTFTSGRVFYGNAVYGDSTNLPDILVTVDGTLRKEKVLDFEQAKVELQSLSKTIGAYSQTGEVLYEFSGVHLNGSDPFLNVFNVSGNRLTNATELSISVPNGSVVLVNVDSTFIHWNGGLTVSGTARNNVLYNFHEAEVLEIEQIDITGSLLAPFAFVDFYSGVIHGQFIAKNVYGTGQFNLAPFNGNIPASKEFTNSAFLWTVNEVDADNNNDYSEATMYLKGTPNPAGDGSGQVWTSAVELGGSEIAWSFTQDRNQQMLMGTWGGSIYRVVEDTTVTLKKINAGMGVAYVWSLATSGSNIFAGTERGVYGSANDGDTWSLLGLSGFDVRSVAVFGSTLYAGTWGAGLFTSTDNGATWVKDEGFSTTPIHSMVINTNGDVYVGTYGEGVKLKKSGETTWVPNKVGNNFVWSLTQNTQGVLFAGTYGDGLWFSNDNGANWNKFLLGNKARHIYSLATDNLNNVYASSWNSGVYKMSGFTRNGSVEPMGLNGIKVSSVFVNPTNSKLYAATEGGGILVTSSVVSNDDGNGITPADYKLYQNYPNPFNPSTLITVDIPSEGKYVLEVYNVLGEKVAELTNGLLKAGTHQFTFSGANLSSGVFIYSLRGDNVSMSKKMVLMK